MYNSSMPNALVAPERARRTQAERRAVTRAALLDATIECLAEEGYVNTTTRRIAERAGVTPGALQHHFATKAELLADARRHLGSRFAQEVLGHGSAELAPIQARTERFLDHMWELLKGSLFQAAVELWIAARTDPELRQALNQAQRDGAHWIVTGARMSYPELAERAGFQELAATGWASMRGLAMLRLVNETDADAAWSAARAHMLTLVAQFASDAGVPS
jgi:AcrR family transcriptional regulator